MRKVLPLWIAVAAALGAAGCVHVRPWQRQKLAKPAMTFDNAPGERLLQVHLYDAREGAEGGEGSGGGGCGCN